MAAYRVIEKLGEGGMGVVYRAVQTSLEREVALKLLLESSGENPGFVARFHREVEASARISHPNVVKILDYGQIEGKPFYAMEYLIQPTLQQLAASVKPFPVPRAIEILRQLLDALSFIHRAGMVHRDLKPANVMIGERDHVTVMDFGLVKFGPDRSILTKTGMIVGTPSYLAPESIRGETVDASADLFSVGCIFHELLTGARTFTAPNLPSLLHAIVFDPHTPVRELRPDCPESLSAVIDRLLAKKADARFPSAAAALAAVEQDAEARAERAANAAMESTQPDGLAVPELTAPTPLTPLQESTIDGGLAMLETVPAAPRPEPTADALAAPDPAPKKGRVTGRTAVVRGAGAARSTGKSITLAAVGPTTGAAAATPAPGRSWRVALGAGSLVALALAGALLTLRPAPTTSASGQPTARSEASPGPSGTPPAAEPPGPALYRAILALDPSRQVESIHRDLRRIRSELWLVQPPRPEMVALRERWGRQLAERAQKSELAAALAAFVAGKGAAFERVSPSPAVRRDCYVALHRLLDLHMYCARFEIPFAFDPAPALLGYGRLERSRIDRPAGIGLLFQLSETNTDRRDPVRVTPGFTVLKVSRSEVFSIAGYASNDLIDATTEGATNRLEYEHPGPLPLPPLGEIKELEIHGKLQGLADNNRLTISTSPDGRSFAPVAILRSANYFEGELWHSVDRGLLTGDRLHVKIEATILPNMKASGEYVNLLKLELAYRREAQPAAARQE